MAVEPLSSVDDILKSVPLGGEVVRYSVDEYGAFIYYELINEEPIEPVRLKYYLDEASYCGVNAWGTEQMWRLGYSVMKATDGVGYTLVFLVDKIIEPLPSYIEVFPYKILKNKTPNL